VYLSPPPVNPEPTSPRMRTPVKIFLALSIPLFLLDWVTKAWIRANLPVRDHIDVIDGMFRIWHRTNTGAAWSLFGDQEWGMAFLTTMGVVAVCAMIWMVRTLPDEDRITAVSLGALAGGAAGNLLDRIRFQMVTDFLDFYAETGVMAVILRKVAGGIHYPTFNVADMAIVTGAILLAIEAIRGGKKAEAPADGSAEAS